MSDGPSLLGSEDDLDKECLKCRGEEVVKQAVGIQRRWLRAEGEVLGMFGGRTGRDNGDVDKMEQWRMRWADIEGDVWRAYEDVESRRRW